MSSYWEERALSREKNVQGTCKRAINRIVGAYDRTTTIINTQIKRLFNTYQTNGKLTYEDTLKLLNSREKGDVIDELRKQILTITDEDVKQDLTNRINAPSFAARMDRLEAIKTNIYVLMKKTAGDEITINKAVLADVYKESYYHSIFDFQQGIGMGFSFATIPEKAIDTILNSKFLGKNYSDRVWSNTNKLAKKLQETLENGIMTGSSIQKMSNEIADLSLQGKGMATRLIRTETNFYMNQGELASYAECGITKYKYLATLDSRTSPMCAALDGSVFDISAAVPGENYPPMHPWCRSTTVAYFDDKTIGTRIARDSDGNTYKVPNDMTYQEWKEKYIANGENSGIITETRQMILSNDINKTINQGNQNKHILSSKGYIEGRSYIYGNLDDAKEIINRYHGTGEIKLTRKGEWSKKEVVTLPHDIGVNINPITKIVTPTNRVTIHYGKKGAHIVPTERREK